MALSNDDLLLVYTGGANNSDGDASLGGAFSSHSPPQTRTTILDNLFREIMGVESAAGITLYRIIGLRNKNADTRAIRTTISFEASPIPIKIQDPENPDAANDVDAVANYDDYYAMGTSEAAGVVPQVIANGTTAPAGVNNWGSSLDIGSLPKDTNIAIYLRFTVPAGAAAKNVASCTIKKEADSPE